MSTALIKVSNNLVVISLYTVFAALLVMCLVPLIWMLYLLGLMT